MDNNYILTENGELYHWGILGMKWGVRRYQRKDGSLTKAGQRRYANEKEKLKAQEKVIKNKEKTKAKLDKLTAKKAELHQREEDLKKNKQPAKTTQSAPTKKSFKNMSDDELREHINRMNLEKQYLDSQKNLAAATPQKVSLGKRFLKSAMDDAIIPAAKNAGKAWVEKFMKDKLGLNETDPLKKLENEYKKLDWQKKINKLKNQDDTDDGDTTYEERNKKETYRKSVADYESGLEDMQRYRKQLESIYGTGGGAQDKIEKKMKERAKEYGIDYGDD